MSDIEGTEVTEVTEVEEKRGLSRRRLLQLAAYSVPTAALVNVTSTARVLAMSLPPPPTGCEGLPGGSGLLADLYSNPWWHFPYSVCCITEAPCHTNPWYPLGTDSTFSARWAGNLIVREAGTYHLRIRGADFVAGALVIVSANPQFVPFGPDGVEVDLLCGQPLLDLVFSHSNPYGSPSWVCFEWQTPSGGGWQPVPLTELVRMW